MLKSLSTSAIAALLLSGCNHNENIKTDKVIKTKNISFSEVSVPKTDNEKRRILASSKLTVNNKEHKIGYKTILRSGDKVGNGIFGLLYDSQNQPIYTEDGAVRISNDNDFLL